MTPLQRHVAFGTGEDDEFPDESLNDNGPATPPEPPAEDEEAEG